MKEFILSPEDLKEIQEASKRAATTPVIYMGSSTSMADHAYEALDDVWKRMGEKYGFIWSTAQGIEGKSDEYVMAEPKP